MAWEDPRSATRPETRPGRTRPPSSVHPSPWVKHPSLAPDTPAPAAHPFSSTPGRTEEPATATARTSPRPPLDPTPPARPPPQAVTPIPLHAAPERDQRHERAFRADGATSARSARPAA